MRFDHAASHAIRAIGENCLHQRPSVALPGHFDKSKFAHSQNGAFCRVFFHAIFEAVEDAALIFAQAHVDEVADHQAADIADAELACDLFRSFQIDAD